MLCTAMKASGEQCRAAALRGADRCWFHSEDRSADRRVASSRGGAVEASGTGSGAAKAIRDRLGELYGRVERGEVDPKRGAVLAQVAGQMLRAVLAERDLFNGDELQSRLEALEQAVESPDPGPDGSKRGAEVSR